MKSEKEEKKEERYCINISLSKYKNTSSSDLTEERNFFQFVFSISLA